MEDSITVESSIVNEEVVYNYDCVSIKNTNELLEENTVLFDFSDFTSNKILKKLSFIISPFLKNLFHYN